MKKTVTLFVITFCIAVSTFAKVYTVTVTNNSFTPATFTIHTGDTVTWIWTKGAIAISSTSIPTGATSWNSSITAANRSFSYIANITGTYNYDCTYNSAATMNGQFTVVSRSGGGHGNSMSIITVYPNPASSTLHVRFNFRRMSSTGIPVLLTMIDKDGKNWIRRKFDVLKNTDLDLQDIPDGNYYLHAEQGTSTYDEQIIIAH